MKLPFGKPAAQAKAETLDGLHRLRTLFPLEQRVTQAGPAAREAYRELLGHWRLGKNPDPALAANPAVAALAAVDAVVPDAQGIGCYPFSPVATGIRAHYRGASAHAMCAVDALAIARVSDARTRIESVCAMCHAPVAVTVEADGSLDHDRVEAARVIWAQNRGQRRIFSSPDGGNMAASENSSLTPVLSCSLSLCRAILFVCPRCEPSEGQLYTLPQATAIGNAFFAFQRRLLDERGA